MKRRRHTDLESDDDEELEEEQEPQAELFDPDSFYRQSKKLKLSQTVENYVDTHFRSCLSNSVRRAMANENPLPNIPALTAPIADNVIVDFMGGAFPSKPDIQLKRLQSTVNAASAPILNLWAELEEQELTTSAQGGLIPVEVVLECFQKTLVLLGNASNYVSQNRRDLIIRKISQKNKGLGKLLNSVCKDSRPEGPLLFGPAVQKAITARAETMAALSKTASKTDPGDHKKFFRQGPTSGYGSGSGKNTKPYNKNIQNTQFKNRGPHQISRPSQPSNRTFQSNRQ